MASLIAGHGHGTDGEDGILGVAPKATILPCGAMSPAEVEVGFDADRIVTGIRWLTEQHVDVILLSLGSEDVFEYEPEAAAGNTEPCHCGPFANIEQPHENVSYPAANSGTIAVSAIGPDGKFSDVSVKGKEVDLAAPGVNIRAADPMAGTRPDPAPPTRRRSSPALTAELPAINPAEVPAIRSYVAEPAVFTPNGVAPHPHRPSGNSLRRRSWRARCSSASSRSSCWRARHGCAASRAGRCTLPCR